jgi:tripartite-type tricarboxylate transporter receptor subunit TctC
MTSLAKLALYGVLGITSLHQQVMAQTWPTKPVRFLSGYAAGGPNDLIARPIAQHLSGVFKHQVIVENKPGANANLAAIEVVKAEPDGHTILFSTTSQITINPALYKMPFDPQKDLMPITQVSMNPSSVVMNASFPANTMKEVIAYAKANPGKMNYASAGNGSINHLAAELLCMITGTRMQHIPMKGGGPALNELLAGRVEMFVVSPPVALPHVKSGKLKIMMISATKRMPQLPDVPTMIEAGFPDFHAQAGTGLLAPARTSQAIIKRLHDETVKYLRSAEGEKLLGGQGVQIIASTPEEFAKVIRDETTRWAATVKAGNIKVE